MAIQVVRRHARLEGAHESFFLAASWRDMPRVRDTTAAFVLAVPAPGELMGAIVDNGRTSFGGGMVEHGRRNDEREKPIIDASIPAAVRRECREEIQGELGQVDPLGYSVGRWPNGRLYRIAYCVARIISLAKFVPSTESSARWQRSLAEMVDIYSMLGGSDEDPGYVRQRTLVLIQWARRYGYL